MADAMTTAQVKTALDETAAKIKIIQEMAENMALQIAKGRATVTSLLGETVVTGVIENFLDRLTCVTGASSNSLISDMTEANYYAGNIASQLVMLRDYIDSIDTADLNVDYGSGG